MGRKLSCFALALTLLCAGIFTGVPGEKVWAAGSTKLIAFTFDDGPSYNTPTLLDGLKQRGAHATFFMAGVNGSSGIVNQSHLLVCRQTVTLVYVEIHQPARLFRRNYNFCCLEHSRCVIVLIV